MEWFEFDSSENVDTPSLVIYKQRMEENIDQLIDIVGDVDRLRPHVKTNKIQEVCECMLQKGISKFKCATVAELEMLCLAKAPDVLMSYPLIGQNIAHLIALQQRFTSTIISFLVDDIVMVPLLEQAFAEKKLIGNVFIDVNVGMGRTGCFITEIPDLVKSIVHSPSLSLKGFHGYDGHIHEGTPFERNIASRKGTTPLMQIVDELENELNLTLQLVIGGTPTFAQYIPDEKIQLSPGTFVFWDKGYSVLYPELPFKYASLVLSRVISIIDANTICLDLGTKAIACEMPQPRMGFLNIPDVEILFQSEEHIVLRVSDSQQFPLGSIMYAVPVHICPTVALYDRAYVVDHNKLEGYWNVVARKRFLTQ